MPKVINHLDDRARRDLAYIAKAQVRAYQTIFSNLPFGFKEE